MAFNSMLVIERRSNTRILAFERGSVNFGTAVRVDCIVRNLSQTGACVELASTAGIPADFKLLIKSGRVARNCRVAWRTLRNIGVQFVC